MHAARRLAAPVMAALLVVLALAPPASAHTELKESSPGDGATVDPPKEIVLTFTESVIVPQVVVTDDKGREHQSGKATANEEKITQPVGALAAGGYTVAWRVVAGDGHPVTGTFKFTVEGDLTNAQPEAPPNTSVATPAGTPTSADEQGGSNWWWVILALVAAGAVAGGISVVRKRSGTPTGS